LQGAGAPFGKPLSQLDVSGKKREICGCFRLHLWRNSFGEMELTIVLNPTRAIRNWYWDSGLTNAELRGISLLKEWLTPEQLTQYAL
jgi:hypothetical protein